MHIIRDIFTYGILTTSLLSPYFSVAQTPENIGISVAEKIYLQLGSEVYASDQEIWYKAIVVDAQEHLPSKVSGVLYVDLIDPNGRIIAHNLTKLNSGLGNGSFELNKNYPKGRYLIRAYTRWNRNFGNDFMYKNYVNVVAPYSSPDTGFLDVLTTTERESGEILLRAKITPSAIESLNEKRIPIYLNFGQVRDTIEITKRNGIYPLAYNVPKNVDWITITLGGNMESHRSETIVLKNSALDIQFFPESGQLVHGFLNKLGVKVLGLDGKGTKVNGSIFDDEGQHITDFKSNHLGMGVFTMQADSTKTYHAKVFVPNDSTGTNTRIYPLPKVSAKGSIISLARLGENLQIHVSSSKKKQHVYIKVSCRGKDHYLIEGPIKNGLFTTNFPSAKLPQGILVFTLMDKDRQPIAERLFFNHKKGEAMETVLKTDKKAYGRRQKTTLNIEIQESKSGQGNTSISVMAINKNHFQPKLINTIRSYFLLDSEIKGEIEDPDYYIRVQTPERLEALDALLLTQGWRNYKYPTKRKGNTFLWPERGIEVKGHVKTGQKPLKNSTLSLTTFGRETKIYTTTADSLGHFGFFLDDDYGLKLKFLLSATDHVGKKLNYDIGLDTLASPKVAYRQEPLIRKADTVIKAVMEVSKERARTRAVFDSLYGVTQLDEVVVSDYLLTPERSALYKEYGKPDVIISGDQIRAKEKEWSYGLFSILMFNYPDEIFIERFPDGFMLAHVVGGRNEPTLLMVDGRLLPKFMYDQIPHMSPNIIERVELIKYAKFFKTRYLSVFPETNPLDAPSQGHIISISTNSGVGLQAPTYTERGTLKAMVDIFSPIKQFYAPKYNNSIPARENKPDLRSLVHWEPLIFTNNRGNASTSFYNGDIIGDYIIVVEAISGDGRIGYGTAEYSVKEPPD